MAELTIKQAAKLYGFHHSSVYQAVAEGRVSAGHNVRGHRVIDMAELIRVWSEPPTPRLPERSNPNSSVRSGNATRTHSNDALAATIADAVAKGVADAIAPLIERLAELENTLRLLEYRPPPSVPVEQPPDPFADLFDSIRTRQ